MDPRRDLMLGALALALAGCGHLPRTGLPAGAAPAPAAPVAMALPQGLGAESSAQEAAPLAAEDEPPARRFASMAPIPNPVRRPGAARGVSPPSVASPVAASGRAAIAAANVAAREPSQARGFLGGVQVFAYDPGRVYEVWTAPLRVTTLTFSRGEMVVSKAAGDTVRWQIGETRSGEGAEARAHVMIKPLVRGLETNLVLATNRRIYLLQLRSGDANGFNAAVTWDLASMMDAAVPAVAVAPAASPALVEPQGPLDAAFRIRPKGRRPAWTPSAVATDGVRTFLSFPPGVTAAEAPALFARGPTGDLQLVNYRQQGRLWVVDRVLDTAELRVGGRRAQVVRIERAGATS